MDAVDTIGRSTSCSGIFSVEEADGRYRADSMISFSVMAAQRKATDDRLPVLPVPQTVEPSRHRDHRASNRSRIILDDLRWMFRAICSFESRWFLERRPTSEKQTSDLSAPREYWIVQRWFLDIRTCVELSIRMNSVVVNLCAGNRTRALIRGTVLISMEVLNHRRRRARSAVLS